jgi:heat shock protein HslJ
VDGDTAGSVPAGVTATVTFADGRATVTVSDCNGGSGSYELDDAGDGTGTVTVSAMESTLMLCGEPSATVEAAIRAVLVGPVDYRVEAATLTLTHPDGRGLTFRTG